MSKRTTFAYHDKMLDIRLAEGHFWHFWRKNGNLMLQD